MTPQDKFVSEKFQFDVISVYNHCVSATTVPVSPQSVGAAGSLATQPNSDVAYAEEGKIFNVMLGMIEYGSIEYGHCGMRQ